MGINFSFERNLQYLAIIYKIKSELGFQLYIYIHTLLNLCLKLLKFKLFLPFKSIIFVHILDTMTGKPQVLAKYKGDQVSVKGLSFKETV